MELKPLTNEDVPTIKTWYKNDVVGHKFLQDYEDVETIIKLAGKSRWLWLALFNGEPVGFVDLEVDGSEGSFSLYVAPNHRRQGHSATLIDSLEALAKDLSITMLSGFVEEENKVSIRSLERAGYSMSRIDQDGLLQFSKHI